MSERGESHTSSTADAGRSPGPAPESSAKIASGAWPSSASESRLSVDLDSDDISDEDELDPDLRAAQDREVEEFARRLNGSLNDLAGQQASPSSSVSRADMFASFVTSMHPASSTADTVLARQSAPMARQ